MKVKLQRDGTARLSDVPIGKWIKSTGFYPQYHFIGNNGERVKHYNLKAFKQAIIKTYIN